MRFIPQQRREEIVAVFIDELRTLTLEVDDLLSSIFNELPEDWKRFNGLKESITNYLKSKKRIDDLRLIAIDEIVNPTA